jgi:hypothetical protein
MIEIIAITRVRSLLKEQQKKIDGLRPEGCKEIYGTDH